MLTRAPRTTIRGLRLRAVRPRFQSNTPLSEASTPSPPKPPKPDYNALYGGLAGGSLVLAGTFAWYHFSGTREVVQTAKRTISTAQQARDKLAEATPSPSAALGIARTVARSYAPFPGVDRVFDQLDEAAEKHGDKVADIVNRAYVEVRVALKEGDAKEAGDKVLKALLKSAQEIQNLTGEVGADVFGPMLDKSPELKRVLGSSYEQLKSTAEKHGPEAQRIASDTYTQLAQLLSQGVNASTIKDATALAQNKTREISQLASKSSSDAWEAARDSAQPLLDRLPDLKKVLDENVESLKGYVGEERVNIIKDLYNRLEELTKSGKPADQIKSEAQQIVKEKVDELRKQGGAVGKAVSGDFDVNSLLGSAGGLDKLKSVPGLGGIVDQLPRFKELQSVAEKRGPEAKKLLDETYEEIRKVLDAKLEEAKKIGGEAKEEAKTSGKKN